MHVYHAITEKLGHELCHPGLAFDWLSMQQFHVSALFLGLIDEFSANEHAKIFLCILLARSAYHHII